MKLYTYYRSQASFRVRIALNLKGVSFQIGLLPGLTHAASTLLSTLGAVVIIVAISRDRCAIGQLLGIRRPREVRHDLSVFAAHWHVCSVKGAKCPSLIINGVSTRNSPS